MAALTDVGRDWLRPPQTPRRHRQPIGQPHLLPNGPWSVNHIRILAELAPDPQTSAANRRLWRNLRLGGTLPPPPAREERAGQQEVRDPVREEE